MLSPIALFVYNRPEHTRLTIKALQDNYLANESDLIIFSDAAKNKETLEAVNKVREVISSITGFSSVRIVEREQNMGLANSIISGVTEVINASGRVIVLEDDLITTPNFLRYMNNSLDHYERDLNTFSIGAYQFPEQTMSFPVDYPHDTYSSYRCCSWGWGTWLDRWDKVDWDMKDLYDFMSDPGQQEKFNIGGPDLSEMLRLQGSGFIDSWAIRFCYAHNINDMRCIYPRKSLVNNIGLDGSGVHCGEDPRRQHYDLDKNFLPANYCQSNPVNPEIAKNFYQAFSSNHLGKEKITLKVLVRKLGTLGKLIKKTSTQFMQVLIAKPFEVDVLFVNTYQKAGGAARSAWRTYLAALAYRPNSKYLTLVKSDKRSDVLGSYEHSWKGLLTLRFAALDSFSLRRYPKHLPVTYTPAAIRNPLAISFSRFKPNLVHLHWIAGSMLRIEDLEKIEVPIIWTLHDTWAFTGGCHYTGTCSRFQFECGKCPQLGSFSSNDLSHSIWLRKRDVYKKLNLTIISPSRWLAEQASKSSLFAGKEIKLIPYGIDLNTFRPIDKAAAKKYLGLNSPEPILLFGAQWLTDPRKGGDLLFSALEKINYPCTLLTFGEGEIGFVNNKNLTVRSLGSMQDNLSLALIYSAADVFLCPSREDNLPNTILEAMACATPCIAFDIGGMADMIVHKANGWLAKPFDSDNFAAGIAWVIDGSNNQRLSKAALNKAITEYSMELMGKRYEDLYRKLLS